MSNPGGTWQLGAAVPATNNRMTVGDRTKAQILELVLEIARAGDTIVLTRFDRLGRSCSIW